MRRNLAKFALASVAWIVRMILCLTGHSNRLYYPNSNHAAFPVRSGLFRKEDTKISGSSLLTRFTRVLTARGA